MKRLTQDEFLDFVNTLGIADKGERLITTIPHIIIYEIDYLVIAWIELHEDEPKYYRI